MRISTKNAAIIRDAIVTGRHHSKIALGAAETLGAESWPIVAALTASDLARIDKNMLAVQAYSRTLEKETVKFKARIEELKTVAPVTNKLKGFH